MDKSKAHKGQIAFIVEADSPGVTKGKVEHKMGQRASNTTEVVFEDVKVPAENRLGQEGEGFKVAMMTLDRTRPTIGASAVGVAKCAMQHSINYAKERKQFGRPIADFQAIQFMIADMAKEIECARLVTWHAGWLVDNNIRSSLVSSISKAFASDACMRITTDAVQIFGGYGYTKEYPVEKLMRDAKLLQIYEGTNQVQRMVIAKEVMK
jgi:acyl-CoA dehydrogenase